METQSMETGRMEIGELLAIAAERGASDLHLSTGMPPVLRVDGDMRPLEGPALAAADVRGMVRQVMGEERRRTLDGSEEVDFACELPGGARFRVNAYRHHRGPAAAFRSVPSEVPGMEELDMGPVYRDMAMAPRGLVLVTGPTGSGKSTTLAALVDFINETRAAHVLTIEDPIEFVHRSKRCLVHQREVGRDTGGFETALRAALREDPDVILVGEMRDRETIALALTAAETGHLVFATLHTGSAAKTIDRIVDAFPAGEKAGVRTALSESLHAVISQTLVPRIGGGRVAAREVLVATPAIRNLIREDKAAQIYSAIQTGAAAGMQTLDQGLAELVRLGVVTLESAREKAKVPAAFGRSSPGAGSG